MMNWIEPSRESWPNWRDWPPSAKQAYLLRLRQVRASLQVPLWKQPSEPVEWLEQHFWVEDPLGLSRPGPIRLTEWQKRLLKAALERDEQGRFRWSTVLWSAPKKSGKTRLAAGVVAWVVSQYGPYAEGYCLANDGKQSDDRVLNAIRKAVELSPTLDWQIGQHRIELGDGSFIEALPVDPAGESGSNPTICCFSELWGYRLADKERFWGTMTLSPARQGKAIRWVESYAGHVGESPVLERLYRQGFEEGQPHPDFPDLPVRINETAGLFCYWDHEGRMPWHTPAYYAAEARLLPPQEFLRLHHNEWVSPESEFVPLEWWDQCQEELPPLKENEMLILAADAAVTGDSFGLVGVTRHPLRHEDVAVRYVHAWYPPAGGKIDFAQPEAEIARLSQIYKVVEVAYDPFQLERTAMEMRRKRIAHWRPFSQVDGRLVADSQLYQLIRSRRVAHDGSAELRHHIMNANARINPDESNRLRIIKRRDGPIDLVVALSMATARCLYLNL